MTRLIALTALLSLPAFAGKKDKNKEAEAPAAEAPAAAPTTPDDGNSKKFGLKLVATEFKDFKPSDAAGAKFGYSAMRFDADMSWTAKGYVETDDERMDCVESGTWSMDKAESAETAPVSWVLAKTDCPGREAGPTTRAILTIGKDGKVEAIFR